MKYQVGDEFKMGYICDRHKHNYKTGVITWAHKYKYYPNGDKGDATNFEMRYQIKVNFTDGESRMVSNLEC